MAVLLWAVLVVSVCSDTVLAMVQIWLSSETYTHGLVVAPISIWLLWRMRSRLAPAVAQGPTPQFLVLLLPAVFLYFAGAVMLVQVVAQFAFVAILIVGSATLMGFQATRVAAFPLLFLFMMVPVGSSLEPPMMDLTAKYTVKLVQLTGIPVYQEGRFFQLPTGSWSVVEACSGVRYLIASVTLGLIYAHLNYRTFGKQLVFVLLSFIVPVFANIGRAYFIVMLGHLSNMELATGVDHLIYGWIFFGLVMLLLFWLGGFWADSPGEVCPDTLALEASNAKDERPSIPTKSRLWVWFGVAALAVLLVRGALHMIDTRTVVLATDLPSVVSGENWSCTAMTGDGWAPRATDVDRRIVLDCSGVRSIRLFADQYTSQAQGREVSRFGTGLKGEDGDRWRVLREDRRSLPMPGTRDFDTREIVLRRNKTGEMVLVWLWYQVDSRSLDSASEVKFAELFAVLKGEHRISSRIYLASPVSDESDYDAARKAAEGLLQELGGSLVAYLGTTETP